MSTQAPQARKEKPRCVKSTPCGYSCIASDKSCQDELSPAALELAKRLIAQISVKGRRKLTTGSNSLTESEIGALLANRDFLESATPAEIVGRATKRGLSELAEDTGESWSGEDLAKITDIIWAGVPKSQQMKMITKGSLAVGSYMQVGSDAHGGATVDRAKFLIRRFVEQNGRDAYTGLPIELSKSDLEHIEPFAAVGKQAERPDNLVFTSPAVNQRKAEKSMADFFKEQVDPVAKAAEADPEYWAKQSAKAAEANAKKNAVADLLQSKAKDSWTDSDIDGLGSKYYYFGRVLGHQTTYAKTLARGSMATQAFNMKMGPPLAKAFAAAYRDGDQGRIDALEQARVAIVNAAKAESKEKKGNAGAAGGLMEQEYNKQQKALGW